MKMKISVKLFFSYLAVLLVGVLVVAGVARLSLPAAYGRHLGNMAERMGNGMGPVRGSDLFDNFQTSFFDALAWALFAALVVALVISLVMSRWLTSPIHALTLASQRVAEGHYEERVSVSGKDELGLLALGFNSMAEKLEQVESMRRRLIGDVAHELRTPLTTIKGSMEGLVDGVLPATAETFNQLASEVERLNRLVDDLQELSRVESGAFQLELTSVQIPDLVDIILRRMGSSFDKKQVKLAAIIPEDVPTALADADRLVQVMTNLLNNALQYTPAGGKVTLSVQTQPGEVLFRVTDTGLGIPPEHLPHIFDRFYRVDKSRSRQEGGGSGIGLTISRALVEAHHGRLWAESDGKDRGSSFYFTIPVG